MVNNFEKYEFELICVIVNFGLGSKLIKSAKRHGFSGGTVTIGRGCVNNRILNYIGIAETRKEVIYLVADKATAYEGLQAIKKEFGFDKPNHGIAFTTSICGVFGSKSVICRDNKTERGAENTMYHVITIIVDKGKAEHVINAATKAGSKGGTIINARGSGIHETSKLFFMEIEPEKEIVIILSEHDMTDSIVTSIGEKLQIDKPGNGIIFVQDANRTYGIYK